MAARVIPFEDNAALNISISATDASPEGCILAAGQGVTFTNNSGSPVTITFNPTTVFGASISLTAQAPGNTNTPPMPSGSVSVNYNVSVGGGTPMGPFAIQVGIGPMFVVVSGPAGSEVCTPDPVAIPAGGTLEMRPALSTNKYNVAGWTNGDPFTVKITSVDSIPRTNSPTSGPGDYPYTVARVSIEGGGGNGGGTIKVKSTG